MRRRREFRGIGLISGDGRDSARCAVAALRWEKRVPDREVRNSPTCTGCDNWESRSSLELIAERDELV